MNAPLFPRTHLAPVFGVLPARSRIILQRVEPLGRERREVPCARADVPGGLCSITWSAPERCQQEAGPFPRAAGTTVQPDISATINGTHVDIGWNWSGFANFLDQTEMQVDRGQGMVALAFDTTPGYVDTQPFPVAPVK